MGGWWTEFGFSESPYGTRALSGEAGDRLLAGRDGETEWLRRKLETNSRIPILIGDNGVGKTSIVNVVAYRMQRDGASSDQCYFVLDRMEIQNTELNETGLREFERNLYMAILRLLLEHKDFLIRRGVGTEQISDVDKYITKIIHTEVGGGVDTPFGGGSFSHADTPNPLAEGEILSIARDWLKKCFCGPFGGGVICMIDNLENYGKPKQIKYIAEQFRDTLFAVPGLLWVLCGTSVSVKEVRSSRRLEGYIDELVIEPIEERTAPELVQRRLDYYAGKEGTRDPPVDRALFQFLYETVTQKHLRTALTLCEDFAGFLYENPQRREEDRERLLRSWLLQSAGRRAETRLIPKESWRFFDDLASKLGGDCDSADSWLFGTKYDKERLRAVSEPLKKASLLEELEADGDFMLRLSKGGWLTHYQRQIQKGAKKP